MPGMSLTLRCQCSIDYMHMTPAELAQQVVDSMDVDTLVSMVYEQLEEYYSDLSPLEFQDEVERHA